MRRGDPEYNSLLATAEAAEAAKMAAQAEASAVSDQLVQSCRIADALERIAVALEAGKLPVGSVEVVP